MLGLPATRRGRRRGAGLRGDPVARRPARLLDDAAAVVEGHVAELDGSFSPAAADALVAELTALGKTASFHRLPRRRPRVLQRGPPRGLRRRRGRAAVGAHGGVPARPARLSGRRRAVPGRGTGRGLPDARAAPGPPHRRHGRRLLRPARAGRGRRGRAGRPARAAAGRRPGPCWPTSSPGAPLDPAPGPGGLGRPGPPALDGRPGRGASPPRAPSWPVSPSATPTRSRPATASVRSRVDEEALVDGPPPARRGAARDRGRWPSAWWPGASPTPCPVDRLRRGRRLAGRLLARPHPASCSACPRASTSSSNW